MPTRALDGPPDSGDQRLRAREAVARGDWEQAYEAFRHCDAESMCSATELSLLATASYLIGQVETAVDAMSRAHDGHRAHGDISAAVRCGFWVVFMLLGRGESALAGGWLARCLHESEGLTEGDAAGGYLVLLKGQRLVAIEHRYEEGVVLAEEAAGLARLGADADLLALALMVAGRGRVRDGDTQAGFGQLDEAMLGVVRDEVSPITAGTVYCAVIEACGEVGELQRAVEWTRALTVWCDRQNGMVTFTGRCLTHQSAVLMLRGEWDAALAEADHARARFTGAADESATGEAVYLLAELHRLAGRDSLAEQSFREAGEWGRDPQPGLALLRLAQGRGEAAVAMVRRLLEERDVAIDRIRVLPAAIEILLRTGDLDAAAAAAEELVGWAGSFRTPGLQAAADRSLGAVMLARDLPAQALGRLREAAWTWRSVGAVYELARTRVLIADACRRLGDDDSADLELAAARSTFAELGAVSELAGLAEPVTGAPSWFGLSHRELEVLRLVATGLTNREVAERLTIAVRTVDRHVTSILAKLEVPSRTAASTFAQEHGIL